MLIIVARIFMRVVDAAHSLALIVERQIYNG